MRMIPTLHAHEAVTPHIPTEDAYRRCEAFVGATGAAIREFDFNPTNRGEYDTVLDEIRVLEKGQWKGGFHYYYTTVFHELVHWSGPRLGRDMSGKEDSEAHCMEELIAQFGAKRLAIHFKIYVPAPHHNETIERYWRPFSDKVAAVEVMEREVERAVNYLLREANP